MRMALFALVVAVQAGFGQIWSPPPLCFGFNDVAPPPFPAVVSAPSAGLLVWFNSPTTAMIDRIEIWNPLPIYGLPVVLEVYEVAGASVPPTAPPIGSYQVVPCCTTGPVWVGANATVAASLVAGVSYALKVRPSQATASCASVFYDPAGPNQLNYLAPPSACAGVAGTPGLGFMVRFRSWSCGPGPPASLFPIGINCGATGIVGSIASTTPPVLGSQWSVTVTGPAWDSALLFWSAGVNPAGVQFSAGSSCLCYLNLVSVAELANLGLEPLLVAPLAGTTTGSVTWTFPIPSDPAYTGVQIGLQAAILGPTGAIPWIAGTSVQVTKALQLTLGY